MKMMKGLLVEENMSNLTSASGEVTASSGSRVETGTNFYAQHSFSSTNEATPPSKKKRSLPGNPDPDAEVIALSPKSLMATNRFLCEICNKGFQRDQNLQLHRRGHNLPWKLKQRTNKVERKKVYVCPEPTCVHHDPSRALGDLTGIKKHFSRKHGEKKWKCEKCSKKYAVQSDWKAHSKICGTREYKCDCGKLFSRRDSFITHRAFCDVLAEESARTITVNPLFSPSQQQPNSSATHMLNFPSHHHHQLQSQGLQALQLQAVKIEDNNQQHHIPPWLACPSSIDLSSQLFSGNIFSRSLLHNENQSASPSPNPNSTSFAPFEPPGTTGSQHTSATALLQKAAQMGATMSTQPSALPAPVLRVPVPHQTHHMPAGSASTAGAAGSSSGLGLSSREDLFAASTTTTTTGPGTAPSLLHDMMMSSFSCTNGFDGSSSSFDDALNGILNPKGYGDFHHAQLSRNNHETRDNNGGGAGGSNAGGSDGLTRDFLGLKTFPHSHRDFVNIAGLDQINPSSSSTFGPQNQNPRTWQG
ncbi:protein indeterminate-domain 7 isoform X2 [Citrus sinensis]|uniref:protein indeterminate-domain 7 isoform X2 n=1 Tax=Citrus sinensis TaxID=2711 RepID=UPI000D62F4F3|nr:protein indeterminate-domain 7 isoform X2 [Citrus sinensis]